MDLSKDGKPKPEEMSSAASCLKAINPPSGRCHKSSGLMRNFGSTIWLFLKGSLLQWMSESGMVDLLMEREMQQKVDADGAEASPIPIGFDP
jgi:hypothetical protein